MSVLPDWNYPPRSVYTGNGRRISRNELIGHEGGSPPIFITWHDEDTGELLGMYDRKELSSEPFTFGEMFS